MRRSLRLSRSNTDLVRRRKIDGILLLDKPLGLSSNQALQQVRWLFQAKKAGHTGSLDPLASGLLPLCFGEASKVSAFLLDSDKTYLTKAQLGATTSTGDAEGDRFDVRPIPILSVAAIESVLAKFRGRICQIPPMYSALKKAGKPLYTLARQGITVEREARMVTIHALHLVDWTADSLLLQVCCSKGTYIRSLVEDIGEALGCGAYVAQLRRLAVSPFEHARSYTLDELRTVAKLGIDALDALLLPMDAALQQLPLWQLSPVEITALRQGKVLKWPVELTLATHLRLYSEQGEFIGIGEYHQQQLRAKRLLAY